MKNIATTWAKGKLPEFAYVANSTAIAHGLFGLFDTSSHGFAHAASLSLHAYLFNNAHHALEESGRAPNPRTTAMAIAVGSYIRSTVQHWG